MARDTDLLALALAAYTQGPCPRPGTPHLLFPRVGAPLSCSHPRAGSPRPCSEGAQPSACYLPLLPSRRENEPRGPGAPHPAGPSRWWPRASHLGPACAPAWPRRARDKRTLGTAGPSLLACHPQSGGLGRQRVARSGSCGVGVLGSKPQCPLPDPTPREGSPCCSEPPQGWGSGRPAHSQHIPAGGMRGFP